MASLNEIVERKDKPVLKIFFSFIGSIMLIDFIMVISKRLIGKFPIVSNLLVVFSVIILCSLIIIKFFSKYSYTLEDKQLIFCRLIGKRSFEMLRLNFNEILYVKPYQKAGNEKTKYDYKFILDSDFENSYVGEFKREGKHYLFIFKPSSQMINEINRNVKK